MKKVIIINLDGAIRAHAVTDNNQLLEVDEISGCENNLITNSRDKLQTQLQHYKRKIEDLYKEIPIVLLINDLTLNRCYNFYRGGFVATFKQVKEVFYSAVLSKYNLSHFSTKKMNNIVKRNNFHCSNQKVAFFYSYLNEISIT